MTASNLRGVLRFELDGETVNFNLQDFQKELRIDRLRLGDELEKQPSLFAWISTLSAEADYNLGTSKQALTVLKAAVGKELRADNTGKGRGERLTEAAIDEIVDTDPTVLEVVDEYHEAARAAAIMLGLREALRERSQMLWSLTQLVKQEMHLGSAE